MAAAENSFGTRPNPSKDNAIATITSAISPNAPACKVCYETDQSVSIMICPCECKGTVALIHTTCLEKWVKAKGKTVCNICNANFEMETTGWKPYYEWSWPRPLRDATEDIIDFRCAILWIVYMMHFVFMQLKYGTEFRKKIFDDAMGNGNFASVWWTCFWLNMLYYSAIITLIADQWIFENRKYRFKDRRHLQTL